MTLYFNNQGVNNEWEKIEFALSKITGERENRAQKWADTVKTLNLTVEYAFQLKAYI